VNFLDESDRHLLHSMRWRNLLQRDYSDGDGMHQQHKH
jgi:hypothetical protein